MKPWPRPATVHTIVVKIDLSGYGRSGCASDGDSLANRVRDLGDNVDLRK
jgi:hypothetical protein